MIEDGKCSSSSLNVGLCLCFLVRWALYAVECKRLVHGGLLGERVEGREEEGRGWEGEGRQGEGRGGEGVVVDRTGERRVGMKKRNQKKYRIK